MVRFERDRGVARSSGLATLFSSRIMKEAKTFVFLQLKDTLEI
jgi:hypothetical protein